MLFTLYGKAAIGRGPSIIDVAIQLKADIYGKQMPPYCAPLLIP